MHLLGTIYSDGKSSTVLSPNNLCDVSKISRSKRDQTEELSSIPATPGDSEDSSLLISEET